MTRTMLSVNIDRDDAVLLHDQVAAEIRRAISEGEAGPGERLPLVKDIAAVLGVNKNTVPGDHGERHARKERRTAPGARSR
jgi:DNA-binding transcriptional MocR family regulator